MKLKTLELKNYRGFGECHIDFDGKTTVFFGPNGVGKSSILDGICAVFAPALKGIILRKGKKQRGRNLNDYMSFDDIKYGESETEIVSKIAIGDDGKIVECLRRKSLKDVSVFRRKKFMHIFNETYLDDNNDKSMPFFVQYGTMRSIQNLGLQKSIGDIDLFDKISALEDYIGNSLDFASHFEWFRRRQEIENGIKIETSDMSYQDKQLQCVKIASLAMLGEHFTDMKIMYNPLRLVAVKDGQNLKIEQLSDGEKCTLAMVGDLARRLAIANQSSGNPLLGHGIVLIDEIELHLHPTWQGKILPVLMKTFPNIQFIITTHSPKVLSELSQDVNIFNVKMEENNVVVKKEKNMALFDINAIFAEYMDTPFLTQEAIEFSDRVYKCIEDKEFDLAQQLVDEWIERTDSLNPEVIKAQMAVKRGRLLDAKNRKEQ